MTGTIVDYGKNYIKILSGERLIIFELEEFPETARMGAIIEFNENTQEYEVWEEE